MIYTFYNDYPENNLRIVGEDLIRALGIEHLVTGELLKFDDVFRIERSLSAEFLDRVMDDYDELPSDIKRQVASLVTYKETELATRYGIPSVDIANRWANDYDETRFSSDDEADEIRSLWYREVNNTIVDFLNSRIDDVPAEDDQGRSNLDYTIVVKATGKPIELSWLFYRVFSVEEVPS